MLDDVVFARALHVLAVAHWIGGLAFVTLVVLPLARTRASAELFDAVERRFAAQVRVSVPLAGATGLWMTWRLELWERFTDPRFWWMPAMLLLWFTFMFVLFVLEPLLQPWLRRMVQCQPVRMLRHIGILHAILLGLAAVTILGVVVGSHGGWF